MIRFSYLTLLFVTTSLSSGISHAEARKPASEVDVVLEGVPAQRLFELFKQSNPTETVGACEQVWANNVACAKIFDTRSRVSYRCEWTFKGDGSVSQDLIPFLCNKIPNGMGVSN